MSEEEIIKEIKIIKVLQDIMQHDLDVYPPKEDVFRLDTKELKAILGLLDLYNKEKEWNNTLLDSLNECGFQAVEMVKDINKNYIPKSKIEEKIEELKKQNEQNLINAEYFIKVLQELLEENKNE